MKESTILTFWGIALEKITTVLCILPSSSTFYEFIFKFKISLTKYEKHKETEEEDSLLEVIGQKKIWYQRG